MCRLWRAISAASPSPFFLLTAPPPTTLFLPEHRWSLVKCARLLALALFKFKIDVPSRGFRDTMRTSDRYQLRKLLTSGHSQPMLHQKGRIGSTSVTWSNFDPSTTAKTSMLSNVCDHEVECLCIGSSWLYSTNWYPLVDSRSESPLAPCEAGTPTSHI